MKTCLKCYNLKPLSDFHKDKTKSDNHCPFCKECKNRFKRQRRADLRKHEALVSERRKKEDISRRQHQRVLALEVLGDRCMVCGTNDRRVLHIDHVDGSGGEERKKMNREQIQRKIIRGDTDNYQLLCANCHAIKTWEQQGYDDPN